MSAKPIAYLTRRGTFSACHRLHNERMSEEQNREAFCKCNNPNGHGHNYVIEVTVRGPVDPITGMVINLTHLKIAMEKSIMEIMDHKNLDKDVDFFRKTKTVSTTESVAVFSWNQLKLQLADPSLLYKVKVWSTEKNIVVYKGEMM